MLVWADILDNPDKGQSLARKIDGHDTDIDSDWAITNKITKGLANIIDNDVVIDIESPSVPIVTTTVSSTEININLFSSDNLSDSIYYDLQYSHDNKNWQDIATNTLSNKFVINGNYGDEYYFRSSARDSSGNISQWSKNTDLISIPINFSREVVINEVAWAGTQNYSDRKWFELYNNTSSSIDISKWKILIDGQELVIKSIQNNIIEPFSYYLFERYDDKTIRDIEADVIYQGNGFKDSGNKIYLINDKGKYIDGVDCTDGWFDGGGKYYKTMKRIDSNKSGNDKNNWSASVGIRVIGRGYSTEYVYGSPRQSNFGFLALNLSQEEDIVILKKEHNPYILQYYKIPVGKKLIIESGVVIKSYYTDSYIDIYGELQSIGSSSEKIIFTSDQQFTE